MKQIYAFLLIVFSLFNFAHASRIKDVATLSGVRQNQLVGYGLVVGLDGSGDQTTQTPFTAQSIGNMLAQMGVNLSADEARGLQLKNVAAVMVTAQLPAFAQVGQMVDVHVASIGNAKSLSGGVLVLTPLKGADGQIYAIAQGNLVLGQEGASPGGGKITPNNKASARIPSGATVERTVPTNVGESGLVYYELKSTDFSTANRLANIINRHFGFNTAQALDGRRIVVKVPQIAGERVAFLSRVENLEIETAAAVAKVVINPRTGSVVMNQQVQLAPCAIAHGNLSLVVEDRSTTLGKDLGISFVKTDPNDPEDVRTHPTLLGLNAGANLAEVVQALNALGATPADLLAILQAMKAAGALKAELEII